MKSPSAASQVHLPVDRAFVVQFARQLATQDPFCGRAEHLASGRVIHFESLSHLAQFVEQVLGATAAKE